MSTLQNLPQQQTINSYLPAVLKENKSGWLIEYYVINPTTGTLARKKVKVNRIISRYKKKSDARKHIAGMIMSINARLAGGWNPFYEGEDARLYEKLEDVAHAFIASRRKELRAATVRTYESVVDMLLDWCGDNCNGIYASVFGHSHAVRYMDYMYDTRNVGAATYNNNLKVLRLLFNWMRERCYTKQNPFEQIKAKTRHGKRRIIIPAETRSRITGYLAENGKKEFLLVCKLLYNSLIRPNELKQLRISDVNIYGRHISISGDVAKNHHPRTAAITQDIIDGLVEMRLERYPPDYFLFGSNLSPAKGQMGTRRLAKEWDKLRRDLRLPAEMQLYSLRDTGIFDMLKAGIDDLSVMQHADHSSLDITTIYANHRDPRLIERIYEKAPRF